MTTTNYSISESDRQEILTALESTGRDNRLAYALRSLKPIAQPEQQAYQGKRQPTEGDAKDVQPEQPFNWAAVGKLIEVTDRARAAGHVVGTSNWGAFVCKRMIAQPEQPEEGDAGELVKEMKERVSFLIKVANSYKPFDKSEAVRMCEWLLVQIDELAVVAQPKQPALQSVSNMQDLQDGFRSGWAVAAKWTNRDDLLADIGSPTYLKDMAQELSTSTHPSSKAEPSVHLHAAAEANNAITTDQVTEFCKRIGLENDSFNRALVMAALDDFRRAATAVGGA